MTPEAYKVKKIKELVEKVRNSKSKQVKKPYVVNVADFVLVVVPNVSMNDSAYVGTPWK